jgi:hypothetical protein
MSVLITGAVLLMLGLWAIGSYSRLLRLRRQVTLHWREVHTLRKRQQQAAAAGAQTAAPGADDADAARALDRAERLYNLVAAKYNAAIESVPGSLFAGLAGFKRAERIDRADAAKV